MINLIKFLKENAVGLRVFALHLNCSFYRKLIKSYEMFVRVIDRSQWQAQSPIPVA